MENDPWEGPRSGRRRRPGRSGPPQARAATPEMDDDALAEQVEAMRAELANSPVEVVIANHCYGLFELAAVYLSSSPMLARAVWPSTPWPAWSVPGGRLGEAEEQLKTLEPAQTGLCPVDGAQRAGAEAASAAGTNGGTAGRRHFRPGPCCRRR